tara:strand:- start:4 stop:111 length:108 start_codon:yes stop_codon:yes gene_type:complete
MTKADLWKQDIITILIVFGAIAYTYILKEWKEFKT